MQIRTYLSKNFINEQTPLFKTAAIIVQPVKDRGTHRDFFKPDKLTETTLEELYKDGWVIKTITEPQRFWHLFFMEKD